MPLASRPCSTVLAQIPLPSQHIMKTELMSILWVWGPVTQYQIQLEGIDSSGDGASDVMEILIREDASATTMSFILDDFMTGFIFTLYEQKWNKFGWYLHLCLRSIDLGLVLLSAYLCVILKEDNGEKNEELMCA